VSERPRAGLVAAKDAISELAASDKLATELEKVFQDPSLLNISSTYTAFVTVLTKSIGYQGNLNKFFGAAKTLKSVTDFYKSTTDWRTDNDTIKSSIDETTDRINYLQDKIESLKSEPSPSGLTLSSTKNSLTITGDGGSIKFLIGTGYTATGPTNEKLTALSTTSVNYIFGDDKQTLKLSRGSIVVDGESSASDRIIIADKIGSSKIAFGVDDWVNVSSTKLSALVHDVDTISFADGIVGNSANNILKGSSAYTTLLGAGGNDKLLGGTSADKLDGQDGNDTIVGGAGTDSLKGGYGRDILSGGDGNDTFIFQSANHTGATRLNSDVIRDFEKGDRIRLPDMDANETIKGNQAFSFAGTKSFSGDAGELRLEKTGKNVFVYGDSDGDKVSDFAIRVDDISSLKASDFIL